MVLGDASLARGRCMWRGVGLAEHPGPPLTLASGTHYASAVSADVDVNLLHCGSRRPGAPIDANSLC